LLFWSASFTPCCFFDNHQYASKWQQQECLVGVGCAAGFAAGAGSALSQLNKFIEANPGEWLMGHVGYGLQAELGGGVSPWPRRDGFADLQFFVPQVVVRLHAEAIEIYCHPSFGASPPAVWRQIEQLEPPDLAKQIAVQLRPRLTRAQYVGQVQALLGHIARGDCYEINYCQEFFAEQLGLNPLSIYEQLSAASPNPFACYYRQQQAHLLCASPERYVMRRGQTLFSQPIKGTAARANGAVADQTARSQLLHSPKERAENVMVVDLVRNDLSQICLPGTVQVEELFGIYSFPQVHQMISTIRGRLAPGIGLAQVLAASFPMGSMTGAPKPRVMALINAYEQGQRGIFSGTVGYVQPNGDFDFNVVIRSVMYNAATGYLRYLVGGGITAASQPSAEYEECMLKAVAIERVLATA
jgi:para-aminobenzoate synthetase component I